MAAHYRTQENMSIAKLQIRRLVVRILSGAPHFANLSPLCRPYRQPQVASLSVSAGRQRWLSRRRSGDQELFDVFLTNMRDRQRFFWTFTKERNVRRD